MAEFGMQREVPVARDVAWKVIYDHDGFGSAAPNLSRVEVLEGDGLGMRRRCYDKAGMGWSETCTLFEPARVYRFEVDTTDYPYPFTKMQGTWHVEDAPAGARVAMHYVFKPKYGLLGTLATPITLLLFKRACTTIMDAWEARMLELARQDFSSEPAV